MTALGQLSFELRPHTTAVERPGGLQLTGSLRITGALSVDRDFNHGDQLLVQVIGMDGEIVATTEVTVSAPPLLRPDRGQGPRPARVRARLPREAHRLGRYRLSRAARSLSSRVARQRHHACFPVPLRATKAPERPDHARALRGHALAVLTAHRRRARLPDCSTRCPL